MIKILISLSFAVLFVTACSDSNSSPQVGHVASVHLEGAILGDWHTACSNGTEKGITFGADGSYKSSTLTFSDAACATLANSTEDTEQGVTGHHFLAQGNGKKARGTVHVTTTKNGIDSDRVFQAAIVYGSKGLELWMKENGTSDPAQTYYK